MALISRGTIGAVYALNDHIVVKRANDGEDERADHSREQRMYRLLETRQTIPYLLKCYHQRPIDTFLEYATNGSLSFYLKRHQEREGNRVVDVTAYIDMFSICRWMHQLCLAAIGFEVLGVVHGDLRPGNMLLNENWDLRLCGLNHVKRIGDRIHAVNEPFGRRLRPHEDPDLGYAGPYGRAGVRSEIFAIGSIFYTMLRGYEPYEMERWGASQQDLASLHLESMNLPELTSSYADYIIAKCWYNKYERVSDLLAEFTGSGPQQWTPRLGVLRDIRWEECEAFMRSGLVDSLPRYRLGE